MKNLIIFLFPIALFSQENKKEPVWIKNTPGQELKLASKHFYIGLGLSAGGALFLFSGISQSQNSGIIAGSIISLAGAVLLIESQIHIMRAGEILDNRKIGFADNGIGITYRF